MLDISNRFRLDFLQTVRILHEINDADLYNPASTKDPATCAERTELDGGWYDYNIYLNSTLYDVQKGHRLVAAITPIPAAATSPGRMTDSIADYSFTVDLENSWVSIPFS